MTTEGIGAEISHEFEGFEGDTRLGVRGKTLLVEWQKHPGLGFPDMLKDDAMLEAMYRFLSNKGLEFEALLKPHVAQTVERCRQYEEVLVLQDTTYFVFEGKREGLGFINKNNRGFLAHVAFAVAQVGEFLIPLGVLAVEIWTRENPREGKKVAQHKLRQSGDCESLRWLRMIRHIDELLQGVTEATHVMDREGDIYDGLSTMVAQHMAFVTRACSNRRLVSEEPDFNLLFDALDGLPIRFRETITVSAHDSDAKPDERRAHPARKGRQAQVGVTATTLLLKRPKSSDVEFPKTTALNVVHVFETDAPQGEPTVEWVLLTNMPIDSDEALRAVINSYRKRWFIEEFFKSIKTGCSFEKRQLTTLHALKNCLAMTLPIAWSLLLFRSQSRSSASLLAKDLVDPVRLKIIRGSAKRFKLPEIPTLRDVAFAVAGLGGHLEHNGPPGWSTLQRGFERLLTLEEGWFLAMNTCAES